MTAAVLFGHGPSSNVRAITRRVVDTLEIGAPLERRPDGLADAGNDELTVDATLTPSTSANEIDLRTAPAIVAAQLSMSSRPRLPHVF